MPRRLREIGTTVGRTLSIASAVRTSETRRFARRVSLICAVSLPLLINAQAAAKEPSGYEESAADYFRGLRSRRLFRLAEAYCLQRLSRESLALPLRTELTLELARTRMEHGLFSPEDEQTELWKQARQVLDDLLSAEPENPRRVLLEAQHALISANSGNWWRWIAELQTDDEAVGQRARGDLSAAIAEFRRLEGIVAEQVRKGASVKPVPGGLAPAEWRSLGQQIRLHLGLALVDLAHVDETDLAAQNAAITAALQALKPLAESAEGDERSWTARIAVAEAHRLSGDYPRALRELNTLEKRNPPRDVADRVLSEKIYVAVALRQLAEGQTLLAQRERQREPLSGELGFLQVILLAESISPGTPPNEAPRDETALSALEEAAERLQRETGGYWGWRGALVLRQAQENLELGPELAALSRRALGAFKNHRLDEAEELYGKAAALAQRQKRGDLAFRFGLMRGSIAIQAQHWGDAAAELLELSKQYPDAPKVTEAQLLAAYALQRLHAEKPSRQRREELTRVLELVRTQTLDPAARGEAVWMLANLAEERGQFTVALELFREVHREHARGDAALAAIARCFERILGRLQELQEPTEAWEREAVSTLERDLPPQGGDPKPLSRFQADAAIHLARILLRRTPADYSAADRWLQRVLASLDPSMRDDAEQAPDDPNSAGALAELRAAAIQLRIVSLAGQGNFSDARKLLETLSAESPSQLLQILSGLAPLARTDRQDPFRELGALQLQAAKRLDEHRAALSELERRQLDQCLAQGHAATGDPTRAIEIYEKLVRGAPRDRALLTAMAELLQHSGNREATRRAPEIWKKLEGLSSAGSDDWLTARYHVCLGLFAAGDKAEACKLLKVTRLLYPKLGGEKSRARFAELEARCGERR